MTTYKTYDEIEARREELEEIMQQLGYEAVQNEMNQLYDMEMELHKKDAIAIARNGKITCFVTNAYECGWSINTKINGEWEYAEETTIIEAMKLFAKIARENNVKTCLVYPEYLDTEYLEEIDRKAREYAESERYNDAVMAASYGDSRLLDRWNREHEIEEEDYI